MTVHFLDKYESLGVLGRGSMGQVHATRTNDPATTVVVKIMRPDLTGNTLGPASSSTARLKYTARLRHPYIVRVMDAGIDLDAGPCIVMEFVPGTTLEQLLKSEQRDYWSTGLPGWRAVYAMPSRLPTRPP